MDMLRNQNQYVLVLTLLVSGWCVLASVNPYDNWINHGGDLYNRRYAEQEVKINPKTVSKLKLKWVFFAGKDITVTPAVYDGTIYFPSWNGNIYAVKASDGSLVWSKNLTVSTGLEATGFVLGVNITVARATPTVAGDLLLIGVYGPAIAIALNRSTGNSSGQLVLIALAPLLLPCLEQFGKGR